MNKQLSIAISKNFLLKTKVMLIIFGCIFIFQIIGFSVGYLSERIPVEVIQKAFFVPVFLLIIVIEEIIVLRHVRIKIRREEPVASSTFYLVSLLEISFPTVVFAFGSILSSEIDFATPYMIMNSPPEFLYFLFMLTTAFLLNAKLCMIIGSIAAIEYMLLCLLFLKDGNDIEFLLTFAKIVIIFGTGILTGVVSRTLRKSVLESLETQRILIEDLDQKVKERTFELNQQKEIIEEKQKEIVDSINYARRIQYTLLAHDDLLKKNLKNYFVLFHPKDIVSGDFYWATQKDNDFYLAVCDSTGHGVPGAFMSLLNISFLNEAITEKNIIHPNEVLNHVRKRLIENVEGGQDGMDATLIRFSSNKIQYASAHNHPLLIRNNELKELAADKMPVGKGLKSDSFNLYDLDVQSGDVIYFFTDGYADQFGGEKGKKFKNSNLQKLLLEISNKDLSEQSQILNQQFHKWKGDLEQVDDVCIIGIKLNA